MARTGGRRLWIAVPVTLLCFAVVAALVWLALPMLPAGVDWAGDSLRGATDRAGQEQGPADASVLEAESPDCRNVFPDDLWSELVWTKGSLLDQDTELPPTESAALIEQLAPTVRVSCTWTEEDGGWISTTLSTVAPDAAAIAQQTLESEGFGCTLGDLALVCTRNSGGIREEHTIREGIWVANVESRWLPKRYGARIDAFLWG